MAGNIELVICVVVPVHICNLQVGFVDGRFQRHANTRVLRRSVTDVTAMLSFRFFRAGDFLSA